MSKCVIQTCDTYAMWYMCDARDFSVTPCKDCEGSSFFPEASVVVQSLSEQSLESLFGLVHGKVQNALTCEGFWEMILRWLAPDAYGHPNLIHAQDRHATTASQEHLKSTGMSRRQRESKPVAKEKNKQNRIRHPCTCYVLRLSTNTIFGMCVLDLQRKAFFWSWESSSKTSQNILITGWFPWYPLS